MREFEGRVRAASVPEQRLPGPLEEGIARVHLQPLLMDRDSDRFGDKMVLRALRD